MLSIFSGVTQISDDRPITRNSDHEKNPAMNQLNVLPTSNNSMDVLNSHLDQIFDECFDRILERMEKIEACRVEKHHFVVLGTDLSLYATEIIGSWSHLRPNLSGPFW